MVLIPRRVMLGMMLATAAPALPVRGKGRTLTCGVMESPPWHLAEDPKQGIAMEVVADLSRHSGFDIQPLPGPPRRLIMAMKSGQLDLIIFFDLPELRGAAVPVGVFGNADMGLVTRPGLRPQSADELAGSRIGVLRGNNRKDVTDKLPPSVTLVELRDLSLGLTMIMGGRLDGLIGTRLALGWHLKQGGFRPDSVGAFFRLLREPIYLYLSTVRQYEADTLPQLQTGMREMDRTLSRVTEYYWKGAGYVDPPPLDPVNPRRPPPP
ncbi:MAG: substrate-binding periplasmic protein [Niveispirillum sp.]|uniref:substrate-binding periplasmic protein n=1 Tax=Niveispirillum sp. TaxID=1917217 RepID=UPI003BA56F11